MQFQGFRCPAHWETPLSLLLYKVPRWPQGKTSAGAAASPSREFLPRHHEASSPHQPALHPASLLVPLLHAEGRTLPCPCPGCRSLSRDSLVWDGGNQEMLEGRQSWALKDVTLNPYGTSPFTIAAAEGRLRSLKPRNLSTAPARRTHTHTK